MAENPDVHIEVVPTPDPNEVALTVDVRQTLIANNPQLMPVAGTLTTTGTTYASLGVGAANTRIKINTSYQQGFGDYQFSGTTKRTAGFLTLHFNKPKTDSEMRAPFRETPGFTDEYWHTVLKALAFVRNPLPRSQSIITFDGQGTSNQITYRVREVYIPGGNYGTRTVLKEFFGPRPFIIPPFEAPIPSSITYDMPGAGGGFPECIHEKLPIPTLQNGVITFISGTVTNVGGAIKGQFYPATNITEWEARVKTDVQNYETGYYRKQLWIYPPDEPDLVVNF